MPIKRPLEIEAGDHGYNLVGPAESERGIEYRTQYGEDLSRETALELAACVNHAPALANAIRQLLRLTGVSHETYHDRSETCTGIACQARHALDAYEKETRDGE